MFGKLYIVATPIGNLEDITLRALRILKESDYILCEDTRVSRILLNHYDIVVPYLSYHQHSSDEKKYEILKLLLEGKTLSLITDAGTPGISDPGNELIDFIVSKEPKIEVIPVPGASSLTSALSVSGMKCSNFLFLGFLPKKGKKKIYEYVKKGEYTLCFFESPKRILKTLKGIEEYLGSDTQVFVACELTKKFERGYRGNVNKIYEDISSNSVRGEMTVVVRCNS